MAETVQAGAPGSVGKGFLKALGIAAGCVGLVGGVLRLVPMLRAGGRPSNLWWTSCALFVASACIYALTRWEPDSSSRRLRRWACALGMISSGFCTLVYGYVALIGWP